MSGPAVWIAVKTVVVAGLVLVVIQQCRKPAGLPGRLFAHIMNKRHRAMTLWGLSHITVTGQSTVLDVGCGGGATIAELAALAPEGNVYGVDYADASVAVARRTNATSIAAGRVGIQRGSVSSLPFAPDTFDVVTAVETHYYWPDLTTDLKEVRRVLKPGGRVALVVECYRGKRFGTLDAWVMRLLGGRIFSAGEHHDALAAAGFVDVAVSEERAKGWLAAVGTKGPDARPSVPPA